jgi:hypothetical protein
VNGFISGHTTAIGYTTVTAHTSATDDAHVNMSRHAKTTEQTILSRHAAVNQHIAVEEHKIFHANHSKSDAKKSVNAPLKGMTTTTTALQIENSFNQLRARLDEREADLLAQLNNEHTRYCDVTEPLFDNNGLYDLLQLIDRFGELQTKVEEATSHTPTYNGVNKYHANDQESLCSDEAIAEELTEEALDHHKVNEDIQIAQTSLHFTEQQEVKRNNQITNSRTSAKISKSKKTQNRKSRSKAHRNASADLAPAESPVCDTLTTTKVKATSKKRSSKNLLSDPGVSSNDTALQTSENSSSLSKDVAFGAYVFNQSDSLTQFEMLHLQNTQGAIERPSDLKKKILLGQSSNVGLK